MGTAMTALAPEILHMRESYEESADSRDLPGDVRRVDLDLDGVPALEVTIDGVEPRGTLVWAHAGAYVAGAPRTGVVPADVIARSSGMRVLSVDYRLAPEHPFPAGRDDLVRAIAAVAAEGPYSLGGESAGGGLALSALLALPDSVTRPQATVVFAPVTDLTLSGDSYTTNTTTGRVISSDLMRVCATAYLGERDRRDPSASPLFGDLQDLPPLLLQAGGADALLDDSTRFALAAADAGTEVRLDVVAGRGHLFQAYGDSDPAAKRAVERVGAYLREYAHA